MDKPPDVATIAATTAASVALNAIVPVFGVIVMGAFGGAVYALMKMPKGTLLQGFGHMLARGMASVCCSGFFFSLMEAKLDGANIAYSKTFALLFVAFLTAAQKEFVQDFAPLLRFLPKWRGVAGKDKE